MAGHGHYAMRRDFGLNTPRMALPEVQDSTGTSNQKKTSDSGGNVVLSSAHHNVSDVGDSSPSLHVRAVRSSTWAKQTSLVENGDKEEEDQRALLYRQQLSEPAHWREEEKASISRGRVQQSC